MAVVQGVKEKVHLPIYDSMKVKPEEQLRDTESSSTLRFFIDVQGKTKLETNLQSAGLLPHYNTFEARALRVVLSDLPAAFPDKPTATDEHKPVTGENPATSKDEDLVLLAPAGTPPVRKVGFGSGTGIDPITATVQLGLDRLMELLSIARADKDKTAEVQLDDNDAVTLSAGKDDLDQDQVDEAANLGDPISYSVTKLEEFIKDIEEKKQPPKEQISPNNGSGNIVSKIIYNTVTTFYVGEKIMIQMPTWFFPAGAGAYSEGTSFIANGEPNPTATFRFAEPIYIDRQQNFRVELDIPDADTLKEIQKIYGPFFIWVVLDGYMTRDVQ